MTVYENVADIAIGLLERVQSIEKDEIKRLAWRERLKELI